MRNIFKLKEDKIRIGDLVFVSFENDLDSTGVRIQKFVCVCGKNVFLTNSEVIAARRAKRYTPSCGCNTKRVAIACDTKEYNIWKQLKQRCYNPNNPEYCNYGGRGITVSTEWLNSFEKFHADMGDCPPGLSIDRIDNDAGYSKQNCRWASCSTQTINQRLRVDNTSGVKGVWFSSKKDKWYVEIKENKTKHRLGSYSSFEEAVAVRKNAEDTYHKGLK